MTFRAVVFLLLWRVAVPKNENPSTFLMDKCDPGMICHELGVDSFQDYAVEFVWVVPHGTHNMFDYVQWKNLKVTERATQGDTWNTATEARTVCRHPIPGAENKMFVQFSSERVEVIKFYEEGKHLTVDKNKNKIFRIMSDFIQRQHISVDNLKHSIIYNSWLFVNATHAIDLKRYMHFDPAETYKLSTDGEGVYRPGRLAKPYWSYGMEHVHTIPNEDIPIEFVDMITSNCFGNPNKYCTIDPRDGTIHYTPFPAVLRMGDFIMEQRWQEVYNDFVPVYRFHHVHMPENEIFYYSNVTDLFFELLKHDKPANLDMDRRFIRGVMPQPKEGDKIFELMMQRTTTTPPPIQSTTPPTSTLKPLPLDGYKPVNYPFIKEMEEESIPALEMGKEVNAASDFVGNVVAILVAIFMIVL